MARNGNTTAGGWGYRHQQLRRVLRLEVERGGVDCWRCSQPIDPAEPWDLGHDDYDRSIYRGPEHRACNRATSGRTGRRWTL